MGECNYYYYYYCYMCLTFLAPFIEGLSFLHWIAFVSLLKINWRYMCSSIFGLNYSAKFLYVFTLTPT